MKCITAPGDNALWFMYEPVLMSKKSFDRLNKKQQDVLMQAGKKSQEYFAKEAKGLDDEMVKAFKDHKVEVVTLTPAEYDAWLEGRAEELLRRVRQGSTRRQEADRRSAGVKYAACDWPAVRPPRRPVAIQGTSPHGSLRPRRHGCLAALRLIAAG